MLPVEAPADSGLPRLICEAVRDWLEAGRNAGKFLMHGQDMGAIYAKKPRLPLRGQFPQLYVVWVSAIPTDTMVCSPQVSHVMEIAGQVRFYTQDPMLSQLDKDCDDLAWAVYAHLRLNRALGGLVTDMTVGRVSGDTEYLLRQDIAANGVVEFMAKAVDTFNLDSDT